MRRMFNIYNNNMSQESKLLTIQNCREDIIGELDAIIQYANHYYATEDLVTRATILDIMDEEKLHVGQLFGLLFSLDPTSKTQFEEGIKEFEELKDKMK